MAVCPLLRAALDYDSRGWCVIPMCPRDKKPSLKTWKSYQTARPVEQQLRDWFRDADVERVGIGIVLGDVSGGLVVRDFDQMAAYKAWAAEHPTLAKTLPTVATSKGRHVYARAECCQSRTFDDGELRGNSLYVVAPPSIHPSGKRYRWAKRPSKTIPLLDPREAGFVPIEADGRATESTENTEDIFGVLSPLGLSQSSQLHALDLSNVKADAEIMGIVGRNLPSGYGNRNRALFGLVRELKFHPRFANCDPRQLRPIVQAWHKLALSNIRTKPFEESWIDFVNAWSKARFSKGAGALVAALAKAVKETPPPCAMQYEGPQVRLLVSLCRQLQRQEGDQPIFMALEIAGELLGVDKSTAGRWLKLFCIDGVLKLIEKGSQATKRVSRYRYLGEL